MIKRTLFSILLSIAFISLLNGQNYDWKQETINYVQVDSISYYFPSNIDLEDRVKAIEDCETAITENLSLINESEYTKAIDILFVNSRKEMLRYTGMKSRGVAYYYRNAVFSLTYQNDSPIKHEMMHMISAELWGIPANSSMWLYEGLATYSAGYCSDYSLEQIYQYYLQTDKLIPIDSLASRFRDYNDLITYTESAFYVKYLIDNYGFDNIKQLWTEGMDSFYEIYGSTIIEFEENLKTEFKTKYPEKIDFNWEEFSKGCD